MGNVFFSPEFLKISSGFFTNISAGYFMAIFLTPTYFQQSFQKTLALFLNTIYTLFYFLLSVKIEKILNEPK